MNPNQPKCHICSSSTSYLLSKDGYPLYRCHRCRLVFIHPTPTENFLRSEVYSEASGYQGNKIKDLKGFSASRSMRRLGSWLLSRGGGRKLLDVGCSNGEFMYYLQSVGFDPQGVELNPRTAKIAAANGLKVFNGMLSEANFPAEHFDIIYLGDVIEHVTSPRVFIEECLRILRRGGYVVVSTPNLDCLWARLTYLFYKIFRIPWSSVTPPHHTYQFSYHNLNLLLNQLGASPVQAWFGPPPRLAYELGSLHLLRRFKANRTIANLIYLGLGYSLYTLFYFLVRIIRPVLVRDFAMTVAYRKHD